ncbi:MAG: DUF1501 domain-containing protein, partial [Chthoniobacteraceae bacterium]
YHREHTPSFDDVCFTRRQMLLRSGMSVGALSLASVFGVNPFLPPGAEAAGAAMSPLAPRKPHFPAKAKAIIHLFASGGPSGVDTWNPAPELNKYDGKTLPGMDGLAYGSPFKFSKSGKSGVETSEVFPELTKHIDEMAVIRSLWTDIPAHEIAQRFMNTGSLQLPKPSVGSWTVYGLGTENQNMPGFVTIGSPAEWRQSSFLPGIFQGTNVNYRRGMPLDEVIANIRSQFSPLERQRHQLDFVKQLNKQHAEALQKDAQLEARIESFEIAFRMQTEATDAFDISKEPKEIVDLYSTPSAALVMGTSQQQGRQGNQMSDTAAKLLVARRLVERGVRFVQVHVGGWDHHANLDTALRSRAGDIDGPAAALMTDLKQRGLLDSTLIWWGGEFGRTVTRDRNGGGTPGRDHNGRAMVAWLAGGGVKGGTAYGATDEFGGKAMTDKCHVHDLHATIMHLMGFDHEKLTYRYNGRDFRLTDNFGNVVKSVIA